MKIPCNPYGEIINARFFSFLFLKQLFCKHNKSRIHKWFDGNGERMQMICYWCHRPMVQKR